MEVNMERRTCLIPTTGITAHTHEPSGRLYKIEPHLLRPGNPLNGYSEMCLGAAKEFEAIPGDRTQDAE